MRPRNQIVLADGKGMGSNRLITIQTPEEGQEENIEKYLCERD